MAIGGLGVLWAEEGGLRFDVGLPQSTPRVLRHFFKSARKKQQKTPTYIGAFT